MKERAEKNMEPSVEPPNEAPIERVLYTTLLSNK